MENKEAQDITEVSATPTAELKFKDGVLCQVFQVTYSDGATRPELREVPSVEAEPENDGSVDA